MAPVCQPLWLEKSSCTTTSPSAWRFSGVAAAVASAGPGVGVRVGGNHTIVGVGVTVGADVGVSLAVTVGVSPGIPGSAAQPEARRHIKKADSNSPRRRGDRGVFIVRLRDLRVPTPWRLG